MAIEEDDLELDEDAAKKGKSSKVKIIIIALVVLLLIGGTVGGTLYFLGGSSSEEMAAEDGDVENDGKKKKKAKGSKSKVVTYYAFDPAFVVNFEDKGVIRFLQITLSAMTYDTAVPDSLKEHDPVIRNNLVLLYSSQSYSDLTSREGKEKLRADTLTEIQSILKKYTDDKGIEEVFFTSFVIQ